MNNGYSNAATPCNVNLTAIDPTLNERATQTGGSQIGVEYNGIDADGDGIPDGIAMYTLNDTDPSGIWRVIFTGTDNCWNFFRRDHQSSRMLAVNQTKQSFPWAIYIYSWTGSQGHISLGISQCYKNIQGVWAFGFYPQGISQSGGSSGNKPIIVPGQINMRFIVTGGTGRTTNYDDALLTNAEVLGITNLNWGTAIPYLASKNRCRTTRVRIATQFMNRYGSIQLYKNWSDPTKWNIPPTTSQNILYNFYGSPCSVANQTVIQNWSLSNIGGYNCAGFADFVTGLSIIGRSIPPLPPCPAYPSLYIMYEQLFYPLDTYRIVNNRYRLSGTTIKTVQPPIGGKIL